MCETLTFFSDASNHFAAQIILRPSAQVGHGPPGRRSSITISHLLAVPPLSTIDGLVEDYDEGVYMEHQDAVDCSHIECGFHEDVRREAH